MLYNFEMHRLGEYLSDLGIRTQNRMTQRARAGADGYELFEITQNLGNAAILGAGAWIGSNNGKGITASGEVLELDPDHVLSGIAIQGANTVRAANDLAIAMDGGDTRFTGSKYEFVGTALWSASYRTGRRILNALSGNKMY